jgi:hypothetical protein
MTDQATRNALLGCIDGGQASMTLDAAVADFPPEHYNTRPTNVPYSYWHLLEHIRICADDIVDYAIGDEYRVLKWPEECWPHPDAEADDAAWRATIDGIHRAMAALRQLVTDESCDLSRVARHANDNAKHTLIREILVTTDHNAYHLGELAILRQVMGLWPDGHA